MRAMRLLMVVLAASLSLSAAPPQGAAPAKALDARRVFDLALVALKEQPAGWANQGFDVRVRRDKGMWTLLFEPVGGPLGNHMLVVVKADGSTAVVPGY